MSVQVVQSVKARLEAQGMNLSGPCGAFAITKRVVWELRDQGYGLLSKPSGNNCEGYATDIAVDAQGGFHDILGDAGGANTPLWGDATEFDKSRWRPAIDPGDAPVPVPTPTPTPTPVPTPTPCQCKFQACNHTEVLDKLAKLESDLSDIKLALAQVLSKQNRRLTGNTKPFGGALVLTPQD